MSMAKKYILIISLLQTFLVGAQQDTPLNLDFLKKEIKSIKVDSTYSNGNWNPVLKEVKNRRIVLLGELNHGSKEIFLSRNDLIKSLHKKHGFNTILFEFGIGELISIDIQKEQLSAKEMTNGLFGGWRTNEFIHLMNFVKSNNISISGFDVQRTGSDFENLLTNEAERIGLDSNTYSDLEKRFSEQKIKLTRRKAVYDSLHYATSKLIEDYTLLKHSLEKIGIQEGAQTSNFIIKTIENRIAFLRYYLDFVKDKNWSKRWNARDFMMFSNIDWLLKTVYKNEKVIVVAHNFHISKFNEKEEVMGEYLKKAYDSEMYSIGVFAGKGSYYNNSGLEENLKPISKKGLDIKDIINKLNYKVGFLDIPKKASKNFNWLFKDIIINDTFIDLSGSNQMNLSKAFDGLIFIDSISPPKKTN